MEYLECYQVKKPTKQSMALIGFSKDTVQSWSVV